MWYPPDSPARVPAGPGCDFNRVQLSGVPPRPRHPFCGPSPGTPANIPNVLFSRPPPGTSGSVSSVACAPPPIDPSRPPPRPFCPPPGLHSRPPPSVIASCPSPVPSSSVRPPLDVSGPPPPSLRWRPPQQTRGVPLVSAFPAGATAQASSARRDVYRASEAAQKASECDAGSAVYPDGEAQRWLSAWFERSGIARRCVARSGRKPPPKLSRLQAEVSGPAPAPSAALQLERAVRRRRGRRARLKLRHQADRQRLLRRHGDIDAWQEDIRREADRRQEAARVRKEADRVLGEVRRKIADVEAHIQTVESLRTLREIRDLKARQSGLFSSARSDQRFADGTARLALLLDRRLVTYEAELRTLTAMAAPPSPPAAAPPAAAAASDAALRVLFGVSGVSEAAAAAADRDGHLVHMVDWDRRPQRLLNVRSAWDRHLVSAEDPLGSGVPPGWVVPVTPSSAVWRSALVQ